MEKLLQGFEPRVVLILLSSSTVVLATLLFTFLLWPQIKAYNSADKFRIQLEQSIQSGAQLESELEKERKSIDELGHRLHGDMANLPSEQIESFIIGRLQEISWQTGVELNAVSPGEGETVQVFREMLFEVELAAKYFEFFDWLQSVGEELGFVVIKRFEISLKRGEQADPDLQIRLTMVSYRTAQT